MQKWANVLKYKVKQIHFSIVGKIESESRITYIVCLNTKYLSPSNTNRLSGIYAENYLVMNDSVRLLCSIANTYNKIS